MPFKFVHKFSNYFNVSGGGLGKDESAYISFGRSYFLSL